VREALLRDPLVQEAVRQHSGEAPLVSQAVQRLIVQVCEEKYPAVAEQVAVQVSEWASDVDLQRRACKYAGVPESGDGQTSSSASLPPPFSRVIEPGPAGVRLLVFWGGIAQCLLALLSCGALALGLGKLIHPVQYSLYAYQLVFSLMSVLIEVPPGVAQNWHLLDRWQNVLIDNASFLSKARGRGFLYLFLGSLWLCEAASFENSAHVFVGIYIAGLGVIYLLVGSALTRLQEICQALRRTTLNFCVGSRSSRMPLCRTEVELPPPRGSKVPIASDL